ncbi:polysaccharide deacetylase family protein [Paenibacillus sp. CF384]|uniref:polysaccharide deacetylase family protein n=1 Tax=Paenibacillus sp. CF384 TaxID=1884382 RepID=UPI00089D8C6E|nr:polysaccharide deacetylase family protein [Paenibacillus sp. CF384]SDX61663.1 Polysaccharide deacetylase [Paenibacillus sp. CF384]
MAKLLIGYDVEAADERTGRFLEQAMQMHKELQAPASIFIVGRTLEQNADRCLKAVQEGWLEFHQHTYSHLLLKTVVQENEEGIQVFPGVSFEAAKEDILRGQKALHDILGIACTGLTAPYNYYRGLSDRLDLLEVLRDCGIKIVRSAGRNERDWQPVPFEWQPYFYEPQGYGQILECPLHGWQDCIARERLGWENVSEYVEWLKRDIDYAVDHDLDFVYCSHDWSSITCDPDLSHLRAMLTYARDKGMSIMNYSDYYALRTSSSTSPSPA